MSIESLHNKPDTEKNLIRNYRENHYKIQNKR